MDGTFEMTEMTRFSDSLDYTPCRYGSSKILFRGPARDTGGDYLTVLGGTETFGRFIQTPYPDLLETATGLSTVNLGCMQPGIDAFVSSPGLLDICSAARATVIQILGAPNMSNRLYTVDPRHNERFMRASKPFKALYPEVDFGEFDRVDHMLTALARLGRSQLAQVRQEVQTAWVARMRLLLNRIEGPKILLWLADHAPYSKAHGGTICREPLFIDRAMLNAVQGQCDALVEVVATPEEIAAGRGEMVFSEFEHGAAQEMLGPVVHARAAEALVPVLSEVLSREAAPEPAADAPAPAPASASDDTEVDLSDLVALREMLSAAA